MPNNKLSSALPLFFNCAKVLPPVMWTGTTIRLRGGVRFPTGGKTGNGQARERLSNFVWQGQQIRCDSGADGIVRMKEDVQ